MSPAAVILVMPVATVALPSPDSHHASLVPTSSSSSGSYSVPSLPLHHARSCFRVYQRSNAASPPSPLPSPVRPPTASDNEVSDLLGGACVDVVDDLLQLHHRRRHCRHAMPWHCTLAPDVDDELIQSGDVTTSVMSAAIYRPSLDFNKMQV